MSLIEIKNLSLTYSLRSGTVAVLKDVNMVIERGEMVAILGPSGSGKSTLLYILGCLLKPTRGSYKLAGTEVTTLSEEKGAAFRASTIGFVFQQFHLLPRANLVENLLLSTRYSSAPASPEVLNEKALKLLSSVGMQTHVQHRPNELSGGQQQRVAICRALMNDPDLILADEPTGNLDSKSAAQVLDILRGIQTSGRTVVIVTHDAEVAKRCDRVITVHDGVVDSSKEFSSKSETPNKEISAQLTSWNAGWREDLGTASQNLLRNKSRSFLTMLGVIIGVAAVLSTLTLGSYTRDKILQTYESLGVNKLVVRAYPRWNIAAKDITGAKFEGVSKTHDVVPMRRLFPEIALFSPVVQEGIESVSYGGQTYKQARILGVSEEYFAITNRRLMMGRPFSSYHVKNNRGVCVLGETVANRLFGKTSPVNKVIQVEGYNDVQYSCLVVGVMAPQVSNDEWVDPNQQILVPDSFLSRMANNWNSRIYEFNMTVRAGAPIEELAEKIKKFLNLKYGRSARVRVDSDSLLIGQMRKFLTLFTVLLTGVALISLTVGGIGIANMMLVSVAERFKEIGLRKALGARNRDIRWQFLMESTILCVFAGLAGIFFGLVGYHTILFFASKIFSQVKFEWVFDIGAMLLALTCIVMVGLLSGLVPALRAEKLQVVEALRSE